MRFEQKFFSKPVLTFGIILSCCLLFHRFIFHGTAGSKVDAPVTFPLELDPHLVSHDCHMTGSLQLAACVCHFGCK